LHGWLDNALSFATLAPALATRFHVVALDLSGHGLSSWRSLDSTYNIWDDVPQLVGILDQLAPQELVLMGHSRGAAIALLLAAVLGSRVRHVVCLDGLLPLEHNKLAAETLSAFVSERARLLSLEASTFPSIGVFLERRAHRGSPIAITRQLLPRLLAPDRGGWKLRSDPRLHGSSAIKLSEQDKRSVYECIQGKVSLLRASDGYLHADLGRREVMLAQQALSEFRIMEWLGQHHFHMGAGASDMVGFVANSEKDEQ
jgi:pimeloyl-ACP methyl ester carboxylesterase